MNIRTTPLNVLSIENPCPKDWDDMTGDSERRFCTHCQKHVHNLSAMPESAATQLLAQASGHLCVRFERNDEGAVKTLEYHTSPRRRGHGWRFWTGVGTGLASIVALFQTWVLGGSTPSNPPGVVQGGIPPLRKMVMGEVNAPPATQPTTQRQHVLMGDVIMGSIEPPTTQPEPPTTLPTASQTQRHED